MSSNRNTVYVTERNAHITGIPLPFERWEAHHDARCEGIAIEDALHGMRRDLLVSNDSEFGLDSDWR